MSLLLQDGTPQLASAVTKQCCGKRGVEALDGPRGVPICELQDEVRSTSDGELRMDIVDASKDISLDHRSRAGLHSTVPHGIPEYGLSNTQWLQPWSAMDDICAGLIIW
mmetsp:Transcript_95301/g.149072  ORF Transcript_95301/g.149072 Transcript_95301/m.149072 type:complete len:109 (+) Transcript_95301:536-862(+)